MGRASNRKWQRRLRRVLTARTVTEQLRLMRLFIHHRKFSADRLRRDVTWTPKKQA